MKYISSVKHNKIIDYSWKKSKTEMTNDENLPYENKNNKFKIIMGFNDGIGAVVP